LLQKLYKKLEKNTEKLGLVAPLLKLKSVQGAEKLFQKSAQIPPRPPADFNEKQKEKKTKKKKNS